MESICLGEHTVPLEVLEPVVFLFQDQVRSSYLQGWKEPQVSYSARKNHTCSEERVSKRTLRKEGHLQLACGSSSFIHPFILFM